MKSPAHKRKKTDMSMRRSKPAPATFQRQSTALLQRTLANPANATSANILALQRTAGNQAVAQLLGRAGNSAKPGGNKPASIQPKLTVGPVGDKYEQEADQVAENVLRMPEPGRRGVTEQGSKGAEEQLQHAQTKDAGETQKKPLADGITPGVQLQPKSDGSFAPGSDFESQLSSRRGGGNPLPAATRGDMEGRFGADFSSVRVHTDNESVQLNRDVQSQAFTHGSDIFFDSGKYEPGSTGGKRLLAHELTHVVQQTGPPSGDVAQRKPNIIQRGPRSWLKKTFNNLEYQRDQVSDKYENLSHTGKNRLVYLMFEDQTLTAALVEECRRSMVDEIPAFMLPALAWDCSYAEAQTIMDRSIRPNSLMRINMRTFERNELIREFDDLNAGTAPHGVFFEGATNLAAGDLIKDLRVENIISGTNDANVLRNMLEAIDQTQDQIEEDELLSPNEIWNSQERNPLHH